MIKKILSAVLMASIFSASAAIVQTNPTKISQINSYESFTNADTVIQVDAPHSSCPGGYWMQMSEAGFKKNMAMVIASFHAQGNIMIYADTTLLWAYSPSPVCLITQIILVR
ncbi:MAG: hypothetical protein ABI574_11990 [Burkholderiales bacterium]